MPICPEVKRALLQKLPILLFNLLMLEVLNPFAALDEVKSEIVSRSSATEGILLELLCLWWSWDPSLRL
jgi:hypothetical protein